MGAWLAASFGSGTATGCTSEVAVGCTSFLLREGAFAFLSGGVLSGVDGSPETRSGVGSGVAGAVSAGESAGVEDPFLRLTLAPGTLLFSGAAPSSCAGSATLGEGWGNASLTSAGEAVFLADGFLARTVFGAAEPTGLTEEREGRAPEVSGDKTDSAAAPFGLGVALRTARTLGAGEAISAVAASLGRTAAAGVFSLRFTGRFALVGGVSGDGAVVESVILKWKKGVNGKLGRCLGGGCPPSACRRLMTLRAFGKTVRME